VKIAAFAGSLGLLQYHLSQLLSGPRFLAHLGSHCRSNQRRLCLGRQLPSTLQGLRPVRRLAGATELAARSWPSGFLNWPPQLFAWPSTFTYRLVATVSLDDSCPIKNCSVVVGRDVTLLPERQPARLYHIYGLRRCHPPLGCRPPWLAQHRRFFTRARIPVHDREDSARLRISRTARAKRG